MSVPVVLAASGLVLIASVIGGALAALAAHLPPSVLWQALASKETLFALRMSLWTSLAALCIAILIGFPTAWLLARRRIPGRAVIETLLDLPMVTPPLVAGMGLLFLLGRDMPVGQALDGLGLHLLFSPAGVVLAQAYIATSVMVRGARAAFQAVEVEYAQISATLGLSPGWTFLLVEIPIAARGLTSAAILAWARALGEFGATLMVAGATRMLTETLPMAVFLNIASGETEVAIACALLLLAFAFLLLLLIRSLGSRPRSIAITPGRHATDRP